MHIFSVSICHTNESLRGVLNVAAVKAPGFGDRHKAILEDIVGYDAVTGEVVDLFEAGIVDPAKVMRSFDY